MSDHPLKTTSALGNSLNELDFSEIIMLKELQINPKNWELHTSMFHF